MKFITKYWSKENVNRPLDSSSNNTENTSPVNFNRSASTGLRSLEIHQNNKKGNMPNCNLDNEQKGKRELPLTVRNTIGQLEPSTITFCRLGLPLLRNKGKPKVQKVIVKLDNVK